MDINTKLTIAGAFHVPLWEMTFKLRLGVGRGIGTLPAPYLTSTPIALSLPDFAHPTFAKTPPRFIIAQAFHPLEEVNIEY